jgi:hypothetical protein
MVATATIETSRRTWRYRGCAFVCMSKALPGIVGWQEHRWLTHAPRRHLV